MKKALIFFSEDSLNPSGGPAGYLYNLRLGLQSVKSDEVEISFFNKAPRPLRETVKKKNMVPKRLREFRRAVDDMMYEKKSYPVFEEMYDYDLIHFHSTDMMFLNREFLKNYKGKVVLTSHSPCAKYQEKLEWLNPFDYKLFKKKIDRIENIDIYGFERADNIIFPCPEAEEPYFNTWERYESIRDEKKLKYMTTGIVGCEPKIDRSEFRKKYNIPDDAFVVSYAGRHNEIKGYTDLKKIGEKLLENENVYFLIAGLEEPITGLDHERWIEVGWTNDPHSLIAASDVFILPNKETYFDLILLEVISLGVPLVLSETGGNKYFKKYCSDGFMFYNTVDEAVSTLEEFSKKTEAERVECGKSVRNIFDRDFTVKTFTENYINIITEILNSGE